MRVMDLSKKWVAKFASDHIIPKPLSHDNLYICTEPSWTYTRLTMEYEHFHCKVRMFHFDSILKSIIKIDFIQEV